MMQLKNILPFVSPDWESIYQKPIKNSKEPLVRLQVSSRLQLFPIYYHQNVTGALDVQYLRKTVYRRLITAVNFLPPEFGIVVLDGWRSYEVQMQLRNNFKKQLPKHAKLDDFVALPSVNPQKPSAHLTGGSVDITLYEVASGRYLDMGSQFDEPIEGSWTAFYERENDCIYRYYRRLLYTAMIQAGFTNLPSEWWHYDFDNQLWAYYTEQPFAHYGPTQPYLEKELIK